MNKAFFVRPLELVSLAKAADGASPTPSAPTEFRILAKGANETTKGVFLFNEKAEASVLSAAGRWGNRYTIDYEHASLYAAFSPDPEKAGRAAGSFALETRNGELWASDVQWTEAGRAAVESKEFRYFSPVFNHSEDGVVTEFINLALTNNPAMHGLTPLVASRGPETKLTMNLLAMLSLPSNASHETALAAAEAALATLGRTILPPGTPVTVAALSAAWEARGAECAALSTEVGKLRGEALAAELDAAVKDGRVAPAQRATLAKIAGASPELFREFLSQSPSVAPAGASKPANVGDGAAALSAEDMAVCSTLGIAPEDYLKTKVALSGAKV